MQLVGARCDARLELVVRRPQCLLARIDLGLHRVERRAEVSELVGADDCDRQLDRAGVAALGDDGGSVTQA